MVETVFPSSWTMTLALVVWTPDPLKAYSSSWMMTTVTSTLEKSLVVWTAPDPLKAHLVSGRSVFHHQAATLNRRYASQPNFLVTMMMMIIMMMIMMLMVMMMVMMMMMIMNITTDPAMSNVYNTCLPSQRSCGINFGWKWWRWKLRWVVTVHKDGIKCEHSNVEAAMGWMIYLVLHHHQTR